MWLPWVLAPRVQQFHEWCWVLDALLRQLEQLRKGEENVERVEKEGTTGTSKTMQMIHLPVARQSTQRLLLEMMRIQSQ